VKAGQSGASTKLGPRFNEAFLFAAEKHAGQTKKGTGVPYISHVMGVAGLVLEAGGDEEMAIAALLHDVVEDCGGLPMLKEVEQRFGSRVARIVDGCTDAYGYPKAPWRERKEKYLVRVRDEDDETRLVSAADKVHNTRAILMDYREIGDRVWERFAGKRDGSLWYYRSLADEFERRGSNRLTRELARVVAELEMLTGKDAGSVGSPKREA
jgi:(p)ppGpp synthase/HD superfamily hydrolase